MTTRKPWDESPRVGLGEDVLNRVDACIRALLRFPEIDAPFHEGDRRALVPKFPRAVFHE